MQKAYFIIVFSALIAAGINSSLGQGVGISFNRDIRPILNEKCFRCHGPDGANRQAGLRLDDRDAATTPLESKATAIVPFAASKSELIRRITSHDDDLRMPPADAPKQLSDAEIRLLTAWIDGGAHFQGHWSFTAPEQPVIPETKNQVWPRNAIDRFVLSKLEDANLEPSPEADRATLIRRVAIDLVGLPPSIEEVDAFLTDASPNAYEKMVDRYLASPHYGERLAIPWLDAARYADSNGFQQDGDTWQWIWRDWIVRALNEDLPFDKFTIWQLAGDLLPDATTDQKIACAFNRNHMLNGEGGAIAEEQRFVVLFDRIDTTATNWLGLTMACAQCHDHKYDPITQKDYYSLMDAFNRVPETGVPQFFSSRIRVGEPFIELPTDENKRQITEMEKAIAATEVEATAATNAAFEGWRLGVLTDGKPGEGKELPEPIVAILQKPENERSEADRTALEAGIRRHFDSAIKPKLVGKLPALARHDELRKKLSDYRNDQIPRVMVMSDSNPRDTFILDRGAYVSPKEKVKFATPEFLPPLPDDAPRNRLGFANWLLAEENPLVARVQVNRMWQYFFGTGLVKTAEDFGVQSEYPVHRELLDWLAVEFRKRNWSMKQMHWLILTSATYRQSSRVTESQRAMDIENRMLSRGNRFRMPSMILRDWALASSGLLDSRIGGKPVYPYQPDGIWESLAITKERDFTYPASSGNDLYRRSLYTFWRRTVGPANIFDASSRQTCRVRSSTTNTPLHALTTLNDPTWVEAAQSLAELSLKSASDLDGQLTYAFRRVLCRPPSESDLTSLRGVHAKQLAIYKNDVESARTFLSVGRNKGTDAADAGDQAAMAIVCLTILNLDEALTRE